MRLHRLRLVAFQAFAEEQAVDFDALSEAGLFLLHGETGAGKTTLLDAVSFALFGDVPGARSEAARLRSDHAPAELRTEVELEATLRGSRVRVTRSPRQARPKVRGTGTTTEQPTARLDVERADGTWETVSSRVAEVNDELQRRVGMSREQFCQVVLLPQGRFAEFLQARSEDRRRLLERIFEAERFEEAEVWVRRRAEDAWRDAADALAAAREVVARLSQAAGEGEPEGWEDEPSLALAWAERLSVETEAAKIAADGACAAAAELRVAADEALASSRELAQRRRRLAEARDELERWQARTPDRDGLAVELAAARRAAPVAAQAEVVAARAARRASTLTAAQAACTALDVDADASRTEVAGVLLPAAPALRALAGARRGEAGAVRALAELEARVRTADVELEGLRAEVARAEAAIATASADHERACGALGDARARAAATAEAAARAGDCAAAAADARARADAGRTRDALALRREHAVRADLEAREAAVKAERVWLDARRARLDGMAAELAAGLADGEACAVCGSCEHPAPAVHDPRATRVDAAAEERLEAEATRRRGEADRAREALVAVERDLARVAALAGTAPAEALVAAAVAAEAEAGRVAALAQDAEPAAGRVRELEREIDTHDEARREAHGDLERARAVAASRRDAVDEDRRRLVAALAGTPDVATLAARVEADADRAEAAATAVDAAVAAAEEHDAAARSAEAAALQAGFATVQAVRDAARDTARCDALEAELRRFDDELARRTASAEDPELLAAGAAPAPDLPAAEARAGAARADATAAERTAGLAEQRRREVATLARQLELRLRTLEPLALRSRRIRGLADVLEGKGSNVRRMRFSAYVLAARLEEIAAAASVRLLGMTEGRYQLVHCEEGVSARGRAGLELRVVDGWTGQERHPATLSGGETFLASLALALGLADVVAAEAGGARLETLFVDEGFGSLDERALEDVLEVLDRLRDGGRAVGIVSHVGELRTRIPAQLRVRKGRSGSTVEPLGPAEALAAVAG